MKSLFKPLLVCAALATAGLGAVAQGYSTAPAGSNAQHRNWDPAKMQERMAKRQTELKARLNLTATQDGAWASFIAAMQPPAGTGPDDRRKMHEEMERLTTPQRIDRLNAMRTRRDAEMARRGEATKAFYASLSPEQQKIFDASTLRHGHGERQGGHGKPVQNG